MKRDKCLLVEVDIIDGCLVWVNKVVDLNI